MVPDLEKRDMDSGLAIYAPHHPPLIPLYGHRLNLGKTYHMAIARDDFVSAEIPRLRPGAEFRQDPLFRTQNTRRDSTYIAS